MCNLRIFRVLAIALTSSVAVNGMAQFVTLEGRQFKVNGQEFYPRVLNYNATILTSNATPELSMPNDLFLSPNRAYGTGCDIYEPTTSPDFTQQFQDEFATITGMGFNTLRLIVNPHIYKDGAARKFRMHVRSPLNWNDYVFDNSAPNDTYGFQDKYFTMVGNLIDIADAAGLKVILLCADDEYNGPAYCHPAWDQTAVDAYATYLSALSAGLSTHPGLLAYDLWNEPTYTGDFNNGFYSMNKNYNGDTWRKVDICGFTSTWYDAINAHDPNHLVTLGGYGKDDADVWDMATMKLDFYSPHLYPTYNSMGLYTDYTNNINPVIDQLYWLGSECPMPYLVGETGFSADDDATDPCDYLHPDNIHLDGNPVHHVMPWMDGSESQQWGYAQTTMNATRQYLGSGYSWWEYQNTRYGNLDSPAGTYKENFYGPIKYDGVTKKIAGVQFSTYTLPTAPSQLPPPPPTFRNWNQFANPGYQPRWYVEYADGTPMGNALVECKYTYKNYPNDQYSAINVTNTVTTLPNGLLVIKSPPSIPGGWYITFQEFRLKLPGGRPIWYTNWAYGPPNYWPDYDAHVSYDRVRFKFDDQYSTLNVANGEYKDIKAWNSLVVANASIAGNGTTGGTADFHARQFIQANSEFHAAQGSEVHIWTEKTFPTCGSGSYQYMVVAPPTAPAETASSRKAGAQRLQLQFQPAEFSISLSPNPCTTHVTVSASQVNGLCQLYDASGSIVWRARMECNEEDIPMGERPTGSYTVEVVWKGHRATAQVVKLR